MAEETYVRLKITSQTRTPEQLTDWVGMSCEKAWRIGDLRNKTIIKEKSHGWVIGSSLPRTASLEEHIDSLLQRLGPFAKRIKGLSDEDNVEFSCVIYSKETPALHFEKHVLQQMASIGASLDIDLYLG